MHFPPFCDSKPSYFFGKWRQAYRHSKTETDIHSEREIKNIRVEKTQPICNKQIKIKNGIGNLLTEWARNSLRCIKRAYFFNFYLLCRPRSLWHRNGKRNPRSSNTRRKGIWDLKDCLNRGTYIRWWFKIRISHVEIEM